MPKIIRKIFKWSWVSLFAILPVALIFSINSTLNFYSYNFKNLSIADYIDEGNKSKQIEWISKRTFSLKLTLQEEVNGKTKTYSKFGTGWIVAKKSSDINDFKYFVGTNIHVANNFNNLNLTEDRYYIDETGVIKKNNKLKFTNFAISFIRPTDENFLKDENGQIITFNKSSDYIDVPIEDIKLSYTATNEYLLDQENQNYFDPYTNKIIENKAIDFAILEMDFAKCLQDENFQKYSVNSFLNEYNNFPTKFAKTRLDKNDKYFIAGFTQDNHFFKESIYPTWLGINDISFGDGILFNGFLYKDIQSINHEINNIRPINGIDFVTYNENKFTYWYKNVASQLLFEGLNLGGGSSGSLICNQNFEIVGIYWGTYSYTNPQGTTKNWGVIDLFITQEEKIKIKTSKLDIEYFLPRYDVYSQIQKFLL